MFDESWYDEEKAGQDHGGKQEFVNGMSIILAGKNTTFNEAGVLLLSPCNVIEGSHASPFPDGRRR
jgi:hypothetical protein